MQGLNWEVEMAKVITDSQRKATTKAIQRINYLVATKEGRKEVRELINRQSRNDAL